MKEKIYSAILIMASLMFINCTSDFETEEKTNAEKAAELRLKILELAEDYDINVKLEDKYDGGNIDIDIEDIEGLFKAISAVRGNYKMIASNNGKTNSLKQVPKRNNRVKTKSKSYETGENFGFMFTNSNDSIPGNPYFKVSSLNWEFECSCMADWFCTAGGKIFDVTLTAQIELLPDLSKRYIYMGEMESVRYHCNDYGNNSFGFYGDIDYKISIPGFGDISVDFTFHGWIEEGGKRGSIDWDVMDSIGTTLPDNDFDNSKYL
ncbi:hypothetical protein HPS56_08745 [Prevotella sp. PMUR]|uniref:Uncharacterized protein n=3 Tax=Xylanibacter muris TaxID=2736290 RepID=A0ABX2ANA6_9BACT|nr:hypothetical protein [Xylanibacter muris]